jgi:hypothetical protein
MPGDFGVPGLPEASMFIRKAQWVWLGLLASGNYGPMGPVVLIAMSSQ